jgi:hypothetical protein
MLSIANVTIQCPLVRDGVWSHTSVTLLHAFNSAVCPITWQQTLQLFLVEFRTVTPGAVPDPLARCWQTYGPSQSSTARFATRSLQFFPLLVPSLQEKLLHSSWTPKYARSADSPIPPSLSSSGASEVVLMVFCYCRLAVLVTSRETHSSVL